ncbi:MAG: hypothetical protein R2867_23760 [Caldilineaceae bacterium]
MGSAYQLLVEPMAATEQEQGIGARLDRRYVNGLLTDSPLWPWPMEGRVQAGLGLSPTTIVQAIVGQWAALAGPLIPYIQDGALVNPIRNHCGP